MKEIAKQADWIAVSIETAAGEDGKRAVRGVANSLNVTRTGRLIHVNAVRAFLASNRMRPVPLLAMHGYVPSAFPIIGRVTRVALDQGDQLVFEAELVSGTQLADEAWTLIQQKALTGVSIGWFGRSSFVRKDDANLDDWTRTRMEDAGVDGLQVFTTFELVEISMVDVPDDRDGKIAARAGEIGAISESLARLEEFLERRGETGNEIAAAVRDAMASDEVANVIAGLVETSTQRIIDAMQPIAGSNYAVTLLDGEADPRAGASCKHREPAGAHASESSAFEELLDRVRSI